MVHTNLLNPIPCKQACKGFCNKLVLFLIVKVNLVDLDSLVLQESEDNMVILGTQALRVTTEHTDLQEQLVEKAALVRVGHLEISATLVSVCFHHNLYNILSYIRVQYSCREMFVVNVNIANQPKTQPDLQKINHLDQMSRSRIIFALLEILERLIVY